MKGLEHSPAISWGLDAGGRRKEMPLEKRTRDSEHTWSFLSGLSTVGIFTLEYSEERVREVSRLCLHFCSLRKSKWGGLSLIFLREVSCSRHMVITSYLHWSLRLIKVMTRREPVVGKADIPCILSLFIAPWRIWSRSGCSVGWHSECARCCCTPQGVFSWHEGLSAARWSVHVLPPDSKWVFCSPFFLVGQGKEIVQGVWGFRDRTQAAGP